MNEDVFLVLTGVNIGLTILNMVIWRLHVRLNLRFGVVNLGDKL